ncbi:nitroreductase family protein [candidate division TA06 bacterium]|uniref:Nitroreductase family protein n=1 Tax=candidate division TA06 bacterium TaxID=2250710 RepID=A0A933MJW5_UNCT6|nr:nitroreductase family protein [candidate division TA06 bacterium]
MDVKTAIQTRRAYRWLAPVKIEPEIIEQLAAAASLAPSCFNKQPWRFVFVYGREVLEKLKPAFSPGNEWCHDASMVIAVFSKKELDCAMKDGREYYLFDSGLAVMALILRATELGLVAHPIAGFDPNKVREVLGIPEEMTVVTLINVGKHDANINPKLSPDQAAGEASRPQRLSFEKFAYIDKYSE